MHLFKTTNLGATLFNEKIISGGANAFVFEVVTAGADTFQLPIYNGGTYNFHVNWGDGGSDIITAYDDAAANHSYAGAGTYTVRITGTINGWRFNNAGDKTLIHDISSWGPLNLGNLGGFFYGCSNLTITASDNLDMTGVTTLQNAFRNCSSLTTAPFMDTWNTAAVTDMRYMFYHCYVFNQSVANFNTAAVTDMRCMFYRCYVFNQSVANFDTAAVTNMGYMFHSCYVFNQSVANFNTAAVTDMRYMFYRCYVFNQSVANFDTAAVTNMGYMFHSCYVFNQSVANFNTAAVTDMYCMFYHCYVFNQSVANFDIAAVTDMTDMFLGVTLPTINYSDIIIAWEGQAVNNNVVFHGGNSKYSAGAAATARQALIDDHTWTITDGGQAP